MYEFDHKPDAPCRAHETGSNRVIAVGTYHPTIVPSSTTEGATMKDAVGYLRVSTQEQGRSGLGLAAQPFDIEQFGRRKKFSVAPWHQDIQTGAGKDAIVLRPGLAAALKEARASNCPLIVSRLDRLS